MGGWQLAPVGGSGDARAPGGEGDALVALGPAEAAGLRGLSCGPGPSPPPQREAGVAGSGRVWEAGTSHDEQSPGLHGTRCGRHAREGQVKGGRAG